MENLDNSFEENSLTVEETVTFEAPVVEEVLAVEDVSVEAPEVENIVEAVEPAETIATDSFANTEEVQAIGTVNGAIGATTAPRESRKPAKRVPEEKKETVAIHSSKNVSWEGVGNVNRGINIVSKAAADKWLTRSHITLATPEEVAREFGK
jgi:hypothetical protein